MSRFHADPLPPLYSQSDLPRILAGHEHADEIARILSDRPHATPGWRQAQREIPFSRLALAATPGEDELTFDETDAMADRSLSVEDVAVARECMVAARTAIDLLSNDELAVLLSDGGAAAKPIASPSTLKRRRASARLVLKGAGVEYDHAAAMVRYLGSDFLGVGRPRATPLRLKDVESQNRHGPVFCYQKPTITTAKPKPRRNEARFPAVAVVEMHEHAKRRMHEQYEQRFTRKAA